MPAGCCSCSPRRRAFFIQFSRRHGRFAGGGVEFATECPLGAAVARLAGVHFSFSFPAGMIVSALWEENLRPSARWVLPFFISPACIPAGMIISALGA